MTICTSCRNAIALKEGVKPAVFCPYCGSNLSNQPIINEITRPKPSPLNEDQCPHCRYKMEIKSKLSSDLGPFGYNPLGFALGAVKVKNQYVCSDCNYKKDID